MTNLLQCHINKGITRHKTFIYKIVYKLNSFSVHRRIESIENAQKSDLEMVGNAIATHVNEIQHTAYS